MILLKNTTSTLKLVTASASNISVLVVFADYTNGNSLLGIDTQLTNITTATNTTIVSAPAASTRREVKSIMVHNWSSSISNAVTLNQDENGTLYELYDCVIGGDEKVQYQKENGFSRLNKRGVLISDISEDTLPAKTHQIPFSKNSVGTSEAAGIFHFLGTGTGIIPAWAIGTSGLGGRAVVNTEAGFLPLPNTSNSLVIERNMLIAGIVATYYLLDVLFVNNGLVVTTTTAQTTNTVTLPNRDRNRSNLGADCLWGLLVTTATTNISTITNCTASYTNQDGTSGKTATMARFPAAAALGSFIPFQLASGDTSIKSIESVTLGTSLVTGAVSLVCLRIIDSSSVITANIADYTPNRKIKIFGDECITFGVMATNAFGYSITTGQLQINEYV